MISGGCFCGAVRYTISAPLRNARSCHCSRCRKTFGTAASAYAEADPDAFAWIAGEDKLTHFESTPGWGLVFCRFCGSTLCGMHGGRVHGVTLGTLDDDPGIEIGMHIFVASKARWDHIGGLAPQFPERPQLG